MTLSNNTQDSVMDEYLEVINQAIEEWKIHNPPEKIRKRVLEKIEKSKDEIILKLLGFDASYGERNWKLDHCNGRSGESAAGKYLLAHASEQIKHWLETVTTPTLTEQELNSIKKSVNHEYKQHFKYSMVKAALKKAEEDAEKMLAVMVDSTNLDSLIKLKRLIG